MYDAELVGAQKALESAVALAGGCPIKMLLDNSEAVRSLKTGRSKSSQATVDKVTTLLQSNELVEIRWIPGHSGIIGNIHADKMAKSALKDFPLVSNATFTSRTNQGQVYTFAALNRYLRDRAEETVDSWWRENRPSRYKDLDLLMKRKRPPELALPRWAYHRLIAARTGHGNFAKYHKRFHHEGIDLMCKCGRERRPWHFSECRTALNEWRKTTKETAPSIWTMLGEKGWIAFYRFLTVTGCYGVQSRT